MRTRFVNHEKHVAGVLVLFIYLFILRQCNYTMVSQVVLSNKSTNRIIVKMCSYKAPDFPQGKINNTEVEPRAIKIMVKYIKIFMALVHHFCEENQDGSWEYNFPTYCYCKLLQ